MTLLQAHHGRCLRDGGVASDSLRFTALATTTLILTSELNYYCPSVNVWSGVLEQNVAVGPAGSYRTARRLRHASPSPSCVLNYICFPVHAHQFKEAAIRRFFNLHNESVLMPPIYCLVSQQNN